MGQSLSGQVALVTGASSGIGEACAVALAAAGAKVVAAARRADRLDGLVTRIAAAGGAAVACACDVADEGQAKAAVDAALQRFGRLDILVNAAGAIQAGNVADADLDQWRQVLEVNLLAALYTSHAALAPMRASGRGSIVNIGSLACRHTSPVYNPYAASKSALYAMTDGLRQEVGPQGIRVCLVAPGATATGIAEGITDPAHREAIGAYVGGADSLDPTDVADAVLYALCLPPKVAINEIWMRATGDIAY